MSKARILGIQIQPEIGDKIGNLEKVQKIVEENAWFKPDLIVLPEVFTSGIDPKYLHILAEKIPAGQTTEFFFKLAQKYKTNIVAGSIIERTLTEIPEYKNTSVVFNRDGQILGKYEKIHLFNHYGSNESEYVTPGNKPVVVKTDIGNIGLSICYDLRFPELYRSLACAGAEIITCVAAWPYPRIDHWNALMKARAIENTAYMIGVNQCGQVNIKRHHVGMSMLVDPWGDVVASAGSCEGVFHGEVNLDYLRKIRQEFPVLNDRKSEIYSV